MYKTIFRGLKYPFVFIIGVTIGFIVGLIEKLFNCNSKKNKLQPIKDILSDRLPTIEENKVYD